MKMVLTLLPDGRAILAVPEDISERTAQLLREAWQEWKAKPEGLFVISGMVEHATSVEIDLPVLTSFES